MIGSDTFRQECLERIEGKVGENHPGKHDSKPRRAERILGEELARLHWTHEDLAAQKKSHPIKLTLAARLRQETTLSVKQIAELLHLGKPKSARTNLHKFMNKSHTEMAQLDWISNEQ